MAVDTGQGLDCFTGVHTFQKSSDGLEVSVAAFDIVKVVYLSVNEVEINLRRAYQSARNRCYVPDTVRRFVRQYLEIITYSHCSNF